MLKEDITSIIVYVLMVAVAAIVGFVVISPAFSNMNSINGMSVTGFLVIGLVIATLLNIILFELFHFLGALVGGYSVLSFNILGFCFYKMFDKETKKVKWKFKFPVSFDGLTGETIITPKKGKNNPMLFVFAPLAVFTIEVFLLVLAYTFIIEKIGSQNQFLFLKYFQLLVVTVGGMLFIYNYFPAKLDSQTDGYRLVLLGKKENIEAYNTLLKIKGDEFLGEEVFEYKTFKEITDFTAIVNLLAVRNFLKQDKFEDSLILIENIIKNGNKVSNETKSIAYVYKLFIAFNYQSIEKAKEIYSSFSDKEKAYLKNQFTTLTIRTAILYFGIVDKSQGECDRQINNFKKALKRESAGNLEYEENMLNKSLELLKKYSPEIKESY